MDRTLLLERANQIIQINPFAEGNKKLQHTIWDIKQLDSYFTSYPRINSRWIINLRQNNKVSRRYYRTIPSWLWGWEKLLKQDPKSTNFSSLLPFWKSLILFLCVQLLFYNLSNSFNNLNYFRVWYCWLLLLLTLTYGDISFYVFVTSFWLWIHISWKKKIVVAIPWALICRRLSPERICSCFCHILRATWN